MSKARAQLSRLFNEVVGRRQPIRLTSRNSSAVLVSEDDWRALEETLFRLSDPGIDKSARKATPIPIRRGPGGADSSSD